MATTTVTTETKPIEFSGASAPRADRPPPAEIVVDTETGYARPAVTGGKGTSSRSAVIARAKERIAQRDGKPAAAAAPAPAATEAKAADLVETPAEEEVIGSGPAGDVAETVPAAEESPEVETEVEGAPAAAPTADPDLQARYELAVAERDRLRISDGATTRERREADLDAISDDYLGWVRGQLADRLGVKPDATEVDDLVGQLAEELTWGRVPIHDLPEQRKAQLELARTRRATRLQQHRRKADQGARQREDLDRRALAQAQRVLATNRDTLPFLALADELGGGSPTEFLTGFLVRGAQAGVIKVDEVTEEAAWQEAARLGNLHLQKVAEQKFKRLSPHFTPKPTVPAPNKPGTAAAPKTVKPTAPAATKSPPAGALPASKAGAAPSKPAEPTEPNQPKVYDMSKVEDPEERRRRVLARWTK